MKKEEPRKWTTSKTKQRTACEPKRCQVEEGKLKSNVEFNELVKEEKIVRYHVS